MVDVESADRVENTRHVHGEGKRQLQQCALGHVIQVDAAGAEVRIVQLGVAPQPVEPCRVDTGGEVPLVQKARHVDRLQVVGREFDDHALRAGVVGREEEQRARDPCSHGCVEGVARYHVHRHQHVVSVHVLVRQMRPALCQVPFLVPLEVNVARVQLVGQDLVLSEVAGAEAQVGGGQLIRQQKRRGIERVHGVVLACV